MPDLLVQPCRKLRIGNVGAGPFYGVFPFGSMDDNFDMRQWRENDGFVGTLSKPFSFQDEWNDVSGMRTGDLLEQDEHAFNKQIEAFESSYWSFRPYARCHSHLP